ncbi:MAG: VWA domain-containing protein, partial [Paracoccaceae bacterium]
MTEFLTYTITSGGTVNYKLNTEGGTATLANDVTFYDDTGTDAITQVNIKKIGNNDGEADVLRFDLSSFNDNFTITIQDEGPEDTIILKEMQSSVTNSDGSITATYVGRDGQTYSVLVKAGDAQVELTPASDHVVEGTGADDFINNDYDGDPQGDVVDALDHSDGSDNDSINAGGGNDIVLAARGDDTIDGGAGDDAIYGDGQSSAATQTTSATTDYGANQKLAVTLTVPDDASCGPIHAEGIISNTPVEQSYNIAIVLDTSGSTGRSAGGDFDGDGSNDTILNVEQEAVRALIDAVVNDLAAPDANVGLIEFYTSAMIVGSYTAGTDADGNGTLDVIDATKTLTPGGLTNYEAGLQQAIAYLNTQPSDASNLVYFLSDGEPNNPSSSQMAYTDEVATLIDPNGLNATIRAFGVGNGVSETKLDYVDDGIDNNSVEVITDLAALNDALTTPPLMKSDVDRVEFYVNGVLAETMPAADLTETPVGLSYDVDLSTLVSGADDTVTVKVVLNDGATTTVSTTQTIEHGGDCDDGDDLLIGGAGNDSLYGMGGDDTFAVDDTLGNDLIIGGESGETNGDTLDLSGVTTGLTVDL